MKQRLAVTPEALAKRLFLRRAFGGAGAVMLGGCDRVGGSEAFQSLLSAGEAASRGVRSAVGSAATTMAQEFDRSDLSPTFRGNGNTDPDGAAYKAHATNGFKDWKLAVDGLVDAPATFSLAELRALPSRTQITRHDCVEGWSAIGQWTGVQLGRVLALVKRRPDARYVVLHCADTFGEGADATPYYESIDLHDAYHPQTLLAYSLNNQALPILNGAPLRLRVERQLGYKHAKYVMRLELVADFAHLGGGKGGYWEDQGYQWYAGI